MTTYYLTADLRFFCAEPGCDGDEAFDAFTDAVADGLVDLAEADAGIVDPDVTAVVAERTMSVLLGVEADCLADAVRLFGANVRTVLRVAGRGGTDLPAFRSTAEVFSVREIAPTEV